MADGVTLVLAGGGLSSLVASATVMARSRAPQIRMVYFNDHRTAAARRAEHARLAGANWHIQHLIERNLPLRPVADADQPASEATRAPLATAQLLIMATACAIEMHAERIVWAATSRGQFDAIARVTEQIEVAQTLARLEHDDAPSIETPLVELVDQQIIELGAHMDVPWQLSWSCLLNGEAPCQVCVACRRRLDAFEAAGLVDPAQDAAGVR